MRELKFVLSGFFKSFSKRNLRSSQEFPIDFVVTWVDGNDPEWQKERKKTLKITEINSNGNGACRYRDWSSFKYWFRAVEKFAPWVRYVYLVTWGHLPVWLDVESPKLKIIKHEDYVPAKFLPTYNCQPLELNLFRIPGLSEHFVYFNDDMFLARPVKPEDFFVNGKPVHSAIAVPWVNRDNELPYHLFFNTYGVVNRNNDICSCIEAHPEKWFSHLYGRAMQFNIQAYQNNGLPGMLFSHMGVPFCRTSMEKTWKKYESEMIRTCEHKVRDITQITHQIFSIEDILSGNFEPGKNNWGICVNIEDTERIKEEYKTKYRKMICLFDKDNMSDAEISSVDKGLVHLFEQIFPEKSGFEKR
ncbi:MAG: stealth family protein [Lachnospiraceae bacterium]|nr:stealth family protein [Lachnospiraceae bacterium]